VVLILRDAERSSVAWKNGGGLTREIAVHPAGSDLTSFDWRVSLAQVRTPGAFSSFPGVQRQLAVLEGVLSLSIAGAAALGVSPASAPITFAGDVPVHGTPTGAVTDLNVMTRRGRCSAWLTRCTAAEPAQLALQAGTTLIVALSPLILRANGTHWDLSRLDAARVEGALQCEVASREAAQGAPFYLAQIVAMPGA
jgi:environmental stress-induced protein Ves